MEEKHIWKISDTQCWHLMSPSLFKTEFWDKFWPHPKTKMIDGDNNFQNNKQWTSILLVAVPRAKYHYRYLVWGLNISECVFERPWGWQPLCRPSCHSGSWHMLGAAITWGAGTPTITPTLTFCCWKRVWHSLHPAGQEEDKVEVGDMEGWVCRPSCSVWSP